MAEFEPVLSGKASAYFLALPRRKQRRLFNDLLKLAGYPSQPGDYESVDDTGRKIQHLRVGPIVISYWADHAVRELRITDIEEL